MRDPDSAALLEGILGDELAHVRSLDEMMSKGANHA